MLGTDFITTTYGQGHDAARKLLFKLQDEQGYSLENLAADLRAFGQQIVELALREELYPLAL